MQTDRYGNALSTSSGTARDHYVDGVDKFLAAMPGVEDAFEAAIAADEGFALAHAALARSRQIAGIGGDAKTPITRAKDLAAGASARERNHVGVFDLMIAGQGPAAYKAVRTHLTEHPRDALITQTCVGVFGMIGFSGQPGRESEQLAFTAGLAPHYGEDWWFLCQHAF